MSNRLHSLGLIGYRRRLDYCIMHFDCLGPPCLQAHGLDQFFSRTDMLILQLHPVSSLNIFTHQTNLLPIKTTNPARITPNSASNQSGATNLESASSPTAIRAGEARGGSPADLGGVSLSEVRGAGSLVEGEGGDGDWEEDGEEAAGAGGEGSGGR
jgi:hypothetical protein